MRRCLVLAVLVAVLMTVVVRASVEAQTVASPLVTYVREGNDFATRVLGDPWDMNEFTDISTSLNNAGRSNLVANYGVSGGIFSGQSTGSGYPYFWTLYPGYIFALHTGKTGDRFPIPSAQYHCLYVRMKVNSTASDNWYVVWSNVDQSAIGQAAGMLLNNDGLPVGSWRNYKVDLNAPPNGLFYNAWNTRGAWQGLRIHPSNAANVWFYVDWVRLTDCNPVNYSFNWTPVSGQTQLWAGIGAQQKDIYIGSISASTASYTWDVQGLMPGTYNLGVQTSAGNMVWLSSQLKIMQTPIVHFTRPSPTSGQDYATAAGDAWDFKEGLGVKSASCVTDSFSSSLVMDTPYPAAISPGCKGSIGEADPKVFLNTPASISGSSYRYLSFYHYINGSEQEPADGMVVRLIWYMNGGTCAEVSQGIPLDVGWQQYTLDLFDPVQGMPEQAANCGLVHWTNSSGITQLRFDPNENWTGNVVPALSFHQEVAWIRLTKEDQVQRGLVLPVQYTLNEPPSLVRSTSFYYTTDRSNPTQNAAVSFAPVPTPAGFTRRNFLPLIGVNMAPSGSGLYWSWDTSNVLPGKYYVCAIANDGYNAVPYCSEAPINVVP